MPKTILIVEDIKTIAETLSDALSSDGFTPLHVTQGQEAINLIQNQSISNFALIVLDVGLPDMSGFEVRRKLRSLTNTPIIFLITKNDEIDPIVGLQIGADDYATKPFSPNELTVRIQSILRRRTSASTIEIHTATSPTKSIRFEHRPDEARILYFGHMLILTRYEYLLLKTLLEKPNHLYSRAQLMDLVWNNAINILDRTIDTHVKSIRAKLYVINDQDDAIQTHRGMGYSLRMDVID